LIIYSFDVIILIFLIYRW